MSSASTTTSLYQAPKLSAFLVLTPSFVFFFSSPTLPEQAKRTHSLVFLNCVN